MTRYPENSRGSSPPEAFLAEAPHQIAIVELDTGGRVTARIHGEAVAIGARRFPRVSQRDSVLRQTEMKLAEAHVENQRALAALVSDLCAWIRNTLTTTDSIGVFGL